MCGRTRCTLGAADISRACHLTDVPLQMVDVNRYRPSYNVGPGWTMPVVRRDDLTDAGYSVHCMKWGLIPSFTKKTEKPDFFRMFNARSESVAEKASFRRLLPKNRCLVAVEGFYEWKKDGSKKQPYYIHFRDGRPLVFAGLYDSWKNSEGDTLYTFTILTTSSSSKLNWLHDRMPVILGDKDATDTWLNGDPSSKYDSLLKPYEHSDLMWHPVTPAMGRLSFDGPECIKEIRLKKEEKGSISKFFVKKEVKEKEDDLKAEEETCKLDDPVQKEEDEESVKEEAGIEEIVDNVDEKSKVKLEFDDTTREESQAVRKKAKMKNDGDNKQPTLLSYFAKK
ncbi:Abasic site processing protein HMCES [Linum perenne]